MTKLEGARAIIRHIAERLQGDLSVELWNGEVLPLGDTARDDIRFVIASPGAIGRLVRSPRFETLVEVYLAGDIDIVGGSPLAAFARYDHMRAFGLRRTVDRGLILRNALPFLLAGGRGDNGVGFAGRVQAAFGHGRDDAAMVQHHYDVSNAFYTIFLGPEMQYSAGLFADPDTPLADAEIAKMDLICRKLRLRPGQRLFDLGCGWGGLACHAAEHFGVSVHGVTLSREQLELARERVRRRGLERMVAIELCDYRTIEAAGGYDAIAQIGMFEHVGLANHDGHFRQMHRMLKDRGLYLHQSITRRALLNMKRFGRPTTYMRFLNRYIFPGGELDHFGMTATNLERHGFEVLTVEQMREHYYRSMVHWAERLYAHRDAAIAEAGPTRTRLWLFYLAMCAMAFQRGILGDLQILAQKRVTGLSGLPPMA